MNLLGSTKRTASSIFTPKSLVKSKSSALMKEALSPNTLWPLSLKAEPWSSIRLEKVAEVLSPRQSITASMTMITEIRKRPVSALLPPPLSMEAERATRTSLSNALLMSLMIREQSLSFQQARALSPFRSPNITTEPPISSMSSTASMSTPIPIFSMEPISPKRARTSSFRSTSNP